jgi:wyosine [tRNA(Phe)-imidazoG37] synthetase (radical SAM superfamily)
MCRMGTPYKAKKKYIGEDVTMTIALQTGHVYGPIFSRRFGHSLGINLLPTDKKVCNFNCVYCQYGDSVSEEKVDFPSSAEIERSIREYFSWTASRDVRPDWIMIAGNGEPTLHPEFSRIVEDLSKLRDQYLPGVRTGILSNSSTCDRAEIRDALSKLDTCFMKLDAGDPFVFRRLNAPRATPETLGKCWSEIVNGLYRMPGVVIQSMFVGGKVDNTGRAEVDEWVEAVRYINPKSVQVYTVSRPTRLEEVTPADPSRLEQIASRLTEEACIPAEVYD